MFDYVCLFGSLDDLRFRDQKYTEVTHCSVVCDREVKLFSIGVPSFQMDTVKQLNDACFPSWVVAAAAVFMQSNRQTSCNTQHISTPTLTFNFIVLDT